VQRLPAARAHPAGQVRLHRRRAVAVPLGRGGADRSPGAARQGQGRSGQGRSGALVKVMPIRYVADVAAVARFYSALGLAGGDGSRSGNWLELESSGGTLGLHIVRESHGDDARQVELSFVAAEPLEKVATRLAAAGFPAGPIM